MAKSTTKRSTLTTDEKSDENGSDMLLQKKGPMVGKQAGFPLHSLPSDPLNFESYLERIETFTSVRWFAKPPSINPRVCARYGWECIGTNTLKCKGCAKILKYAIPGSVSTTKAFGKMGEQFAEKLETEHQPDCFWVKNPCPTSFEFLPTNLSEIRGLVSQNGLSYLFKRDKLLHVNIEQEPKERIMKSMTDNEEENNLLKQPDVIQDILIMAASGWFLKPFIMTQTLSSTANQPYIQCKYCNRCIGLNSFDWKAETTTGILNAEEFPVEEEQPPTAAEHEHTSTSALAQKLSQLGVTLKRHVERHHRFSVYPTAALRRAPAFHSPDKKRPRTLDEERASLFALGFLWPRNNGLGGAYDGLTMDSDAEDDDDDEDDNDSDVEMTGDGNDSKLEQRKRKRPMKRKLSDVKKEEAVYDFWQGQNEEADEESARPSKRQRVIVSTDPFDHLETKNEKKEKRAKKPRKRKRPFDDIKEDESLSLRANTSTTTSNFAEEEENKEEDDLSQRTGKRRRTSHENVNLLGNTVGTAKSHASRKRSLEAVEGELMTSASKRQRKNGDTKEALLQKGYFDPIKEHMNDCPFVQSHSYLGYQMEGWKYTSKLIPTQINTLLDQMRDAQKDDEPEPITETTTEQ